MSKNGWRMPMDKGYPLPEDHLPEGRVCVQFEIPDDQTYAADVVGHIMELGKWWNWEKDGGLDRRATETAQLFRKALHETLCVEKYRTMGCNCPDPNEWLHRVGESGALEVSKDGGETWETDPTDPRVTASVMPNLPGTDGDSKRCQAAANITKHIREKGDQIAADATLWSGVQFLIGALVGLLIFIGIVGSGGALTPIILAFGGTLLSAGQAAFVAAMTEDVYDQFQCMIYCHLDLSGNLEPGGLDAIKAQVSSDLTGIAVTFLNSTLDLLGEIGVNNMGKTGSGVEADCSECCPSCVSGWTWGVPEWTPTGFVEGENYLEADAYTPGNGYWYWPMKAIDSSLCCDFVVTGTFDPATTSFCARYPCDVGGVNFGTEGSPWINDALAAPHGEGVGVMVRANYPYTARITFS